MHHSSGFHHCQLGRLLFWRQPRPEGWLGFAKDIRHLLRRVVLPKLVVNLELVPCIFLGEQLLLATTDGCHGTHQKKHADSSTGSQVGRSIAHKQPFYSPRGGNTGISFSLTRALEIRVSWRVTFANTLPPAAGIHGYTFLNSGTGTE